MDLTIILFLILALLSILVYHRITDSNLSNQIDSLTDSKNFYREIAINSMSIISKLRLTNDNLTFENFKLLKRKKVENKKTIYKDTYKILYVTLGENSIKKCSYESYTSDYAEYCFFKDHPDSKLITIEKFPHSEENKNIKIGE